MSINSVASNVQTMNLIQRTMSAADLDKNGQLSSDEFANFFTKLLDGLSSNAPTGSSANTGATTSASATFLNSLGSTEAPVFAPVPGFDTAKLNNLSHVNDKYTASVRVFSRGLAALGLDAVTSRGHLDPMVDFAKANGFPNAKTVSDDQIDFGDGKGAIDCITASGTWWFQNQK